MNSVRFIRTLADGSEFILGHAVYNPVQCGWKFIPNIASHKPSRKYHPTVHKCLPRWVGYPNHCRSEERP